MTAAEPVGRVAALKPWSWTVREYLLRPAGQRADLTPGATALYQFLASAADRYGESWYQVASLRRVVWSRGQPASVATVQRWRAELVDAGLLHVEYATTGRHDDSNLYRLVPVSPAKPDQTSRRIRRIAAAKRRQLSTTGREHETRTDVLGPRRDDADGPRVRGPEETSLRNEGSCADPIVPPSVGRPHAARIAAAVRAVDPADRKPFAPELTAAAAARAEFAAFLDRHRALEAERSARIAEHAAAIG